MSWINFLMFLLQKWLLMQVVLLKCVFFCDFTDKRIQAVVSYMSITDMEDQAFFTDGQGVMALNPRILIWSERQACIPFPNWIFYTNT